MSQMKKKVMIALLIPFVLGAFLVGCGPTQAEPAEEPEPEIVEEATVEEVAEETPEPEPQDEPEEEPEPEYRVIGMEDEKAFELLLTNNTGQDITQLEVKTSEEEDYPEGLIKEDEPIEQMETVQFFYTPAEEEDELTEQEAAEAQAEDEKAEDETDSLFTISYDVRVTLEDETVIELQNFGFEDMEETEICYEDEIGFIKYTSLETGDSVSTKEAQRALLEEQREAEEQAERNAQEAKQQPSAPEPKSEPAPAPAPEPAPAQDPDVCIPEDEIEWND